MRLSVTDRCNFRCIYCMKEDQTFGPMRLEMTTPEVIRVANVAHALGIRSLRLTGGEPLIRKDVVDVVRQLSRIGFEDLSLTTNGSLLTRRSGGISLAQALKEAGLDRVNISCDSLDPQKFSRIRRRGNLELVFAGIDEARRAGLTPIKVNVVVIRGQNDDEILEFARLARDSHATGTGIVPRFIEFMPLGETGEQQANWTQAKVVSAREIIETVRSRWPLKLASSQGDHAPATRWAFADGGGEIGVIPTMTNPFCSNCNRLRVTADGFVMRCLFSKKEGRFSLRDLMRTNPQCTDADLAEIFRRAVDSKKAGQDRDKPDIYANPGRYSNGSRDAQGSTMSQIGG